MRTFLLIGGSGFLGTHIADLLARNSKDRVVIMDRHPPSLKLLSHPMVSFVDAQNLTKDTPLREHIQACDVCIYLASSTVPATSNEDPVFDIQTNLIPLIECLEELRKHNEKRLVYASSGGTIYGPNKLSQQSEDSSTNPICSYGIVKLAAEKYLQMYSTLYGLNTVSLRIANPYGLSQLQKTSQGAIGVFISKALKREPIQIWGDGSISRDYIWAEDVANAFVLASDYSGPFGCFNIGTGRATTLTEIISMIEMALNRRLLIEYRHSRGLDVASSALDSRLALQELGWHPTIDLRTGIERMCAHAVSKISTIET